MINIKLNPTKLDYYRDEAYKSLRTNLQFCGADKKVIALTSCTPNEGKSNVSFYLSISLAESGKNVLLIDCDLRKSVMLGRVTMEQEIKGVTHYLSRQAKLSEVICTTDIPKFHMIFSGPVPPNPAELLGSNQFRELIRITRDVYDYIIVDTPPLGSVIDSAVIAENCDGMLMVIESEAISYRFAQEVKQQLEKTSAPLLGVVLNKVDISKQSYYGSKYGKYGKYSKYDKYGE